MKDLEKIGTIGVVAAEICPMVGIALLGAAVVYGGFMLGGKLVKMVTNENGAEYCRKSSAQQG